MNQLAPGHRSCHIYQILIQAVAAAEKKGSDVHHSECRKAKRGLAATLRRELEGPGAPEGQPAVSGDGSLPVGRRGPGPSEAQRAPTAAAAHWR